MFWWTRVQSYLERNCFFLWICLFNGLNGYNISLMKTNFCLVCFSTIQTIKLVLQLEDLVDILDEKTLSLLISIKHVEKMGKQIIQMTWCLWVLLRQIGLVKIWKMTQINQPIFFLTNNNVIKIVLESKGGETKFSFKVVFKLLFGFLSLIEFC